MEENFYEEFDYWEDENYEDENEEEDEVFTASPPNINFDELEDFADDVREVIEQNQKNIDYAKRELNSVEKSIFLERELINIENVIKEVKTMLDKRHTNEETLSQMNPGSATAWALEDKQQKREMALKQRMTLRLAGIDYDSLSDLTDDASNVLEDSYDDKYRQLRKEIKSSLKGLSYSEREETIKRLLEDGRIDQNQYNYLISEFL